MHDKLAWAKAQREKGLPTVPSTIGVRCLQPQPLPVHNINMVTGRGDPTAKTYGRNVGDSRRLEV